MRWMCFISVILCSLCLTACLRMSYQPRGEYLLNQNCPSFQNHSSKFKGVTLIEKTVVQSPFSGNNFIYRTDNENYLVDYYNLFLAPPAEQISPQINRCLAQAKLFDQTVDSAGITKPNYWLNTNLSEMYADYRDRSIPKAVLTIQFELYQESIEPNKTIKIFNKTYHEAIPLQKKNSESLVDACNEGLQESLRAFENDLMHSRKTGQTIA